MPVRKSKTASKSSKPQGGSQGFRKSLKSRNFNNKSRKPRKQLRNRRLEAQKQRETLLNLGVNLERDPRELARYLLFECNTINPQLVPLEIFDEVMQESLKLYEEHVGTVSL